MVKRRMTHREQNKKGVANLSTLGDPDKAATPYTCSPTHSLIKKGGKAHTKVHINFEMAYRIFCHVQPRLIKGGFVERMGHRYFL